jgi:glyceraldehyde 3-phosphate dehydrogenase
MEKKKVAINGLGRIGKQFLLAAMERGVDWDFVINHTGDLDFIVYTLKYDSVHPAPLEHISHDGKHLIFGEKKIKVFSELNPEKLPWKKEGIDLVVECTGLFTDREGASKHLKAGAKKVLISAPAHGHDATIVMGVNDALLKKEHTLVSAGSCTTNCTAPMVKILHDTFKIKNAFFVTTHAYTSTQKLIDGHDQKDLRRGRAAAIDIVPSTSGASQSVIEAVPEIKGKLEGYALRVPVVDGSITTLAAHVENKISVEEVNTLFMYKAKEMMGVLEYTEEPIVSADIIHNPHSCIFDATLTRVSGNLVSIAGWYDNEWGYSCRLVDVAKRMIR